MTENELKEILIQRAQTTDNCVKVISREDIDGLSREEARAVIHEKFMNLWREARRKNGLPIDQS